MMRKKWNERLGRHVMHRKISDEIMKRMAAPSVGKSGEPCMDDSIFEVLENLIYERQRFMEISGIKMVKPSNQVLAGDDDIYILRKGENSECYLMVDAEGRSFAPDGDFIFVVPMSVDDRGLVICGRYQVERQDDLEKVKFGHASLSHGNNVYYAGTMAFAHGVLRYWTNISGHYLPAAEAMRTHLSPLCRLLLPGDKFLPWKEC